jgi:Xaa-Pro aminopeptidase
VAADTAKLDRVRADEGPRPHPRSSCAPPDNIVYLTNYWCMKDTTLPSFPARASRFFAPSNRSLPTPSEIRGRSDIRLFKGYDERDPRPPTRGLGLAPQGAEGHRLTDKVGVEPLNSSQAADRMVGEPAADADVLRRLQAVAGQVVDAIAAAHRARSIKTAQIERMRIANELAALAMEHCRQNMKPGMKESEVGAMFEGFVHGVGVSYQNKVEMARAFTLVCPAPASPPSPPPATAPSRRTSPHSSRSGCAWMATGTT